MASYIFFRYAGRGERALLTTPVKSKRFRLRHGAGAPSQPSQADTTAPAPVKDQSPAKAAPSSADTTVKPRIVLQKRARLSTEAQTAPVNADRPPTSTPPAVQPSDGQKPESDLDIIPPRRSDRTPVAFYGNACRAEAWQSARVLPMRRFWRCAKSGSTRFRVRPCWNWCATTLPRIPAAH